MTKEEIKKVVDSALNIESSTVEKSLESQYYVYTNVWRVTAPELERIDEALSLVEVVVDGGKLLLSVLGEKRRK